MEMKEVNLSFVRSVLKNKLVFSVYENRKGIGTKYFNPKLLFANLFSKSILFYEIEEDKIQEEEHFIHHLPSKKQFQKLYPTMNMDPEGREYLFAKGSFRTPFGCMKFDDKYLLFEIIDSHKEPSSKTFERINKRVNESNIIESNKSILDNLDIIIMEIAGEFMKHTVSLEEIVKIIDNAVKLRDLFGEKVKEYRKMHDDPPTHCLIQELYHIKKDVEDNNIKIDEETTKIFERYTDIFSEYKKENK